MGVDKAECEYEKYRVIQDQKYISSMDEFYKKYFNEFKNVDSGIKWIYNVEKKVIIKNNLQVTTIYRDYAKEVKLLEAKNDSLI